MSRGAGLRRVDAVAPRADERRRHACCASRSGCSSATATRRRPCARSPEATGVSTETIYKIFGGKAGLVAGDPGRGARGRRPGPGAGTVRRHVGAGARRRRRARELGAAVDRGRPPGVADHAAGALRSRERCRDGGSPAADGRAAPRAHEPQRRAPSRHRAGATGAHPRPGPRRALHLHRAGALRAPRCSTAGGTSSSTGTSSTGGCVGNSSPDQPGRPRDRLLGSGICTLGGEG